MIKEDVARVMEWEDNVNLIPAIFEEVCTLREEIETIKAAPKLLDRRDDRVEHIEQRLTALEHRIG